MIQFQLSFKVSAANQAAFEAAYKNTFRPALAAQAGFQDVKLARLYSDEICREIQAGATDSNYELVFQFDTEANRRKWAASEAHASAWAELSGAAEQAAWRGYDVVD